MPSYSLTHLADHVLLRDLAALLAKERSTTAEMLAHLAEVDARKLYLPAAYPSMYLYCLGELGLSEDAAAKRIQAARAARDFPEIFALVADGRLHLSAVVLLAPHLTRENAADLLAAAAHKSKAEIALLLAERFPQPDLATSFEPLGPRVAGQHAPGHVDEHTGEHAPGHVGEQPGPRARVVPLSPERYALQVTLGQGTRDKLAYAQALLAHAVPTGEFAQVLERALDALIEQLERRRFASTARSRPGHRAGTGRYVPAGIRREVWQRDGGQCTFVSDRGRRCEARKLLEFDHIEPLARGGTTIATGLRLRCRAHNQYAAACAFGSGFMERKREQARAGAVRARTDRARAAAAAIEPEPDHEVIPWLRQLGYRMEEARRGARSSATIPDASLEERLRIALRSLAPAHPQPVARIASSPG